MTTLTADRATEDAREALEAAGIKPQKIISTDMGDCRWMGGHVIETEARVTYRDVDAAMKALVSLPGATACDYSHACACVYRLAS